MDVAQEPSRAEDQRDHPAPTVYRAEPPKPWAEQLQELLTQAAALGARHGVDPDAFMRGAWTAYMDARPGLREHLEEVQLKSQLDELRKQGRVGEA